MMMSERLTTEQIAEIKARRADIIDGAWKSECRSRQTTGGLVNLCSVVNSTEHSVAHLIPYERYAVFIAHAPDDIDALLAALEAERADNERLRSALKRIAEANFSLDRDGWDAADYLQDEAKDTLKEAPAVNPAAGQDGD